MPFPNYWAVRIRNPEDFKEDKFFTKEVGDGILAVFGELKDKENKIAIQSLRFSKEIFKKEDVVKWLRDFEIEYIKLESKNENGDSVEDGNSDIDIGQSYEAKILSIKNAMIDNGVICNTEEWDVVATFPDFVVFYIKRDNCYNYFMAHYTVREMDSLKKSIEFTDIEALKISFCNCQDENQTVDIQESEQKQEEQKHFNESFDAQIILNERLEGKPRRGIVKQAQVADIVNKNNRIYPKEVLETAVLNAQKFIKENGALYMDSQHRVVDGKNYRDIRETVGLINEINFVNDKYVEIGFVLVDTQAGKDFQALVDAGAKFQVSQRGSGTSKMVMLDNKPVELVTSLVIDGFDFIPSGNASVDVADVIFLEQKMSGGDNMDEKDIETKEQTEQVQQENNQDDISKEEKIIDMALDLSESIEDREDTKMVEQIERLKTELEQELAKIKHKELLEQCKIDKVNILQDMLSQEKYNIFNETQKKALIDKIRVDDIVPLCGTEEFKAILEKRLNEEAEFMTSVLASSELEKLGKKEAETSKGRVYVVQNERKWMETVSRITPDLEREVKKRLGISDFPIGSNHPAMSVINRMVERFEEINYKQLLNESGEEVTQSDIGVKVATISRAIIPIAFRNVTAFDVCDVGNMSQRIENVMYSVWNAGITGVVHTDVSAIEISEGGTIPTAGIQYISCPILATRKTLKTKVTSEAVATAKGTGMNPIQDTITALGVDISRRIDQLLWFVMIAQGQRESCAQVTSYETLTALSDGLTYKSQNIGWMQYEYVKTYDSNGNPTASKLVPLFGNTSGNTLQAVVVGYGATPTLLSYETDYTINWADGSIKLTATGAGKVGTDDVKAKYTYTNNVSSWSVIPPIGVSGYENLVNLRQAIGRAKVAVASRNYTPNVIATSLSIEDLLTSSPMFTNSGATPADILDKFNNISVYAGMQSVKTSALPDEWILVFEKNACIYRNFIPLSISGGFKITSTGDEEWIAEEYSGQDVPVKGKISLVAVLDLKS